jgi:hypothetical protein
LSSHEPEDVAAGAGACGATGWTVVPDELRDDDRDAACRAGRDFESSSEYSRDSLDLGLLTVVVVDVEADVVVVMAA